MNEAKQRTFPSYKSRIKWVYIVHVKHECMSRRRYS